MGDLYQKQRLVPPLCSGEFTHVYNHDRAIALHLQDTQKALRGLPACLQRWGPQFCLQCLGRRQRIFWYSANSANFLKGSLDVKRTTTNWAVLVENLNVDGKLSPPALTPALPEPNLPNVPDALQ
eukprot:1145165-Pelagomonas_calceolata.AAC.1